MFQCVYNFAMFLQMISEYKHMESHVYSVVFKENIVVAHGCPYMCIW